MARHMIWNERTVEKWLRKAADTAYGLRATGYAPQPLRAWWPDSLSLYPNTVKTTPAIPGPAAIDELRQVESWVNKWLSNDERRVVWERAAGLSWRKVAAKCKRWGLVISHEKSRIVYRRAIWTLVRGLNGKEAVKRA